MVRRRKGGEKKDHHAAAEGERRDDLTASGDIFNVSREGAQSIFRRG